ncbi:MAG: S8 family serine peptidase [Actinomycetota bacterium]|nr:S8 family serine peptidase [Actinomycetota bacterium]
MSKVLWFVVCLCAGALVVPGAASASGKPIPGQYIVVLEDGTDVSDAASDHSRRADAEVIHTYGAAIDGYAARVSDAGLGRIKADPRVAYVMQDVKGNPTQAETTPTGINRIDAELASPVTLATTTDPITGEVTAGSNKVTSGDVAIFDSGIDTAHPDLEVAGGVNCLGTDPYQNRTIGDEHGHGTHVAGTVGAKDNGSGVIGVAPGVRLWSVRVLNKYASGSASTQLCGINWLTANAGSLGIKVVNSSQVLFGKADDGNCGYTAGDALHKAICTSTQAGITWVFAAGNSASDYKLVAGASYDEVLTVTAMGDGNGQPNVPTTASFSCVPAGSTKKWSGTDDKFADFSKYATLAADKAHTIAAPGACIYSTWKAGGYMHANGTSMATPHVTAVAHRCILAGQCTGAPAEIIQKLRSDAAAYNEANPGYGFSGDPLRPQGSGGKSNTQMYFGHLVRAAQY